MSAFICDDHTIHGILTIYHAMLSKENRHAHAVARDAELSGRQNEAHAIRWGMDSDGSLSRLGQMLVDENYRSVNYRYSEKTVPAAYKFQALPIEEPDRMLWVAAHSLIRCLNYQSCECPDYEDSKACEFLRALQKKIEDWLVPDAADMEEDENGERYAYVSKRLPKLAGSLWDAGGPDVFLNLAVRS